MTNGLTKLARVEYLPAQPGVDPIPAFAERFFLTPSPKNTYYVREGDGYVLKPGWPGSGNAYTGKSYRLPATELNGVPNETGQGEPLTYIFPPQAGIVYNFVDKPGDTTPSLSVPVIADANGAVLNPPEPADKILAFYVVTPAKDVPPTGTGVYSLPAGVSPIRFLGVDTLANGFPRVSGTYMGTADIPDVSGGTRPYTQPYAPTGPNGSYVPVNPALALPLYTERRSAPYYQMVVRNFPGAPGTDRVPVLPVFKMIRAWDAGANSIATVSASDLYVKFQVGLSLGVKIGFYEDWNERDPVDASVLRAAFYCYSSTDGFRWSILDDGRLVSPANNTYDASTTFEIRRIGDRMVFLVDDSPVYTTVNKLSGSLRVGTAMYSTGDFVL